MTLTDEDKQIFNDMLSGEFNNFALIEVEYEGEVGSAICVVTKDKEEDVIITPMFLRITDRMFTNMKQPDENGGFK